MRKELVVEAMLQASARYDLRGSTSHSDRGSQYTSEDYRKILKTLNIIQSMNGAAGRCHDNAKCESMWARAKSEITAYYNPKKMTCEQLKTLLVNYFLDYWNHRRICSAIGGVPPLVKRGAYYIKQGDRFKKPMQNQQQIA
jgi:transposase InsO family protein